MSNPDLKPAERERLVSQLMRARRDVAAALREADPHAECTARAKVHKAKLALGERGPVWWDNAEGDVNRKLVANTDYAKWFASLPKKQARRHASGA